MNIFEIIEQNGGITLKFCEKESTQIGDDFWYFPLYPDITTIVSRKRLEPAYAEFTAVHAEKLAKRGRYLGVWRNPKTGQYYFDINIRSKTKLRALKRMAQINKVSQRQILAAYNPARDEVVNR